MSDFNLKDIISHANIIIDNNQNIFTKIKSEIVESNKINKSESIFFEVNQDLKDFNLKIEEIEMMQSFQKSFTSKKRYILINKNLRNTIVQNALLKTLEEPNSNVSIIIFVNNISLLLKTIISRSQVYDFSNNYDSADKYKALKDKLIQIGRAHV